MAMSDDDASDPAVLDLIALGAPVTGGHGPGGFGGPIPNAPPIDLLPTAITHRHDPAISMLLDKGLLLTEGKVDQAKINAAFNAAIEQGNWPLVQQFWPLHPALIYQDTEGRNADDTAKAIPVTHLLGKPYNAKTWDGFDITKLLLAQGCDVNASGLDGKTLLHIAAKDGTPAFLRYLLDHGAALEARDEMGNTPLHYAYNDDNAILLLEAGADPNVKSKYGNTFAEDAKLYNTKKILAWLAAHDIMASLPHPPSGY